MKVFVNQLFLLLFFVSFFSCSDMGLSEEKRIKKKNEKGEFIFRESDEFLFSLPDPEPNEAPKYIWEENYVGSFPRLTKEFFRCKGSASNVDQIFYSEEKESMRLQDCDGKHSLPLKEGKEFVYPVLIDILNYIQEKTRKRVVITSGHRCPKHNTYVDHSPLNKTSKHMIAAEVGFYVQGMEEEPEKVVDLILTYYLEAPQYQGDKNYQEFTLYEGPTNVSQAPLRNKEVFVKLFRQGEGRNHDNRHSFPYVSIQVRYDKEEGKKVLYTWNDAYNNYYRF